jgi:hypothetical protein
MRGFGPFGTKPGVVPSFHSAPQSSHSAQEAIVGISRTALHPPVLETPVHHAMLADAIAARVEAKGGAIAPRIAGGTSIKIPLSTVSRVGNFDALISLRFGIPGNSVDAADRGFRQRHADLAQL